MADIYKRLDLQTAAWLVSLILLFIVVPVVKVNGLEIDGGKIATEWWMYPLGVFLWDLALIVLITAIGMVGMLLAKLHNYLSKGD